jgi:hypothetical protein
MDHSLVISSMSSFVSLYYDWRFSLCSSAHALMYMKCRSAMNFIRGWNLCKVFGVM